MQSLPLVSVICLCHNQKPFVAEAIRSVLYQTYQNIELIVVDDGSTDGSKAEIEATIAHQNISFIDIPIPIGNCAAFNKGLRASKGDYLIDLAADDMLLPARIELGINDFINSGDDVGVHFSDAFLIHAKGSTIRTHYERNSDGQLKGKIPEGNIYSVLIQKYFISAPAMMMKREVLEDLGGYDESLSYEDFDFWIRSSRKYLYLFNKAPLVKKRVVKNSHGRSQSRLRNKHLYSTFRICEKIYNLNETREEDIALIRRCNIEVRQCLKTLNFGLITSYQKLKRKAQRRLSSPSSIDK